MLINIAGLGPTLVTSGYFLIITIVVFLSVFLSKLCIVLERKTKLSEAAIGVILLGAITSFPELITSISSIFVQPNNGFVAIGDILGSNLFDLFILSCFLIYFLVKNHHKKLDQINIISIICMICNSLFCFLGCVLNKHIEFIQHFNMFTIGFFLFFIINTYYLIKSNKKNKIDVTITNNPNDYEKKLPKMAIDKLSTWSICWLTILTSLVLITSSYFLTIFAMQVNIYLKLDNAFGGAILLGIVTSLPEIISCISLAKNKYYNMLVGNIIGSINFNFLILFFTNILLSIFYGNEMFAFFGDNNCKNLPWQIIFLVIQNCTKQKNNTYWQYFSLVIICLCYISFLVIGGTNHQ